MTAMLLLTVCAANPVVVTVPHPDSFVRRAREREIRRTRRDLWRFPERRAELLTHLSEVRATRHFLPILRPPYQRHEWGVLPRDLTVLATEGDAIIAHTRGNWQDRCVIRGLPALPPGTNFRVEWPLMFEGRYTHKLADEYSDRDLPSLRVVLTRPLLAYTPLCAPKRMLSILSR